jgi:histone H3/H4
MKRILPGGDIGRVLELAPELLLAGDEAFAGAVAGVAAELAEKGNGKTASRRDVYQAAAKLVRDGGAASLLARGETQKAVVVPVTEKANVHFSG